MNPGSSALRCAIVAASLLAPRSAHAECFTLTAPFVMRESVFELVFSGTVVEVTRTSELAYRATFDVDRVWKGSVAPRIDLYVWELSAEIPRFEAGPSLRRAREEADGQSHAARGWARSIGDRSFHPDAV